MKRYCRAYLLGDLRRFDGWRDGPGERGEALADDTVVYLWDDLTVAASPVIPDSPILWNTTGGDWARFCRDELSFEIPEELVNG